MKIPSKIKIGGLTYKIDQVSSYDMAKGCENWGKTDFSTLKIKIDKELPQERKEEAFLHEVFHTIIHCTGLFRDIKEKEEDFVVRISQSTYQVLVDNKLLRKS